MNKNFDDWFVLKPQVNNGNKKVLFQEREIWWCSIGINVGCETDGKNNLCERPVLVYKKYNSNQFFGFPVTSVFKEGKYYCELTLKNKKSVVMLSQGRTFDGKRLIRKLTKLTSLEFEKVKVAWQNSLQ